MSAPMDSEQITRGGVVRERKPRRKSHNTNDAMFESESSSQLKNPIGRTPDGSTFVVPQTHDMVSQLFSPSQPKNISDYFVVLALGLHIFAVYWFPNSLRAPMTAALFLFWRACYNAGIGYLLHLQSKDRRLVNWAKRSNIFTNPKSGTNPSPMLYAFLKREMETKITGDYDFQTAPIEYNTWLLFRRFVDLILMCDFVSYCLYAIVCGAPPTGQSFIVTTLRWTTGALLFLFNLWVKLDAHRVVKDYAWYWGDFFYLIEQKLTFDGVFEMAPHPMYSIGYAGYYGISLMAASYRVLAISLVAHAAQFAFLFWVENPHIKKTYNTPAPRKQRLDTPSDSESGGDYARELEKIAAPPPLDTTHPVHNVVGIRNIDLHRVGDTSVILLQILMFALTFLTPSTPLYQAIFVANAAIWRLWYSIGIGFILNRQSIKKRWTRHFLKHGESIGEAWRQWKAQYHISMVMCYVSLMAAAWKMYSFPTEWERGLAILKHVVGFALIGLQTWTSTSIYESLGEFGWFFGDFFYEQNPQLNYSGIYRFLNNPERIIGLAGVWGAALITWSAPMFCLALLSHILALAFIQFVERPHMQKLYGQSLRRESGFTKSLKKSLPPNILQLHGSVDRIMEGTLDSIEEFIDAARPKFATGVSHLVKDASAFFKQPTRIMVTRVAADVAGFDPKDYSLEIEGSSIRTEDSPAIRTESKTELEVNQLKPITLPYGAPIRVRWTAPLSHSKKDWVGLYMASDNASREVTHVRSRGRWIATNKDQFDFSKADQGILVGEKQVSSAERRDGAADDFLSGEMEFSGDKLWWRTGVFEFRYHHNGKYNVMAISRPFEISINKFDESDLDRTSPTPLRTTVEKGLLQLIRNCFDRDPEIAPSSADEPFGALVEKDGKFARRVVYAVNQMFGIELAPEVVQADGTVRKLAWRICNAKRVLEPFMSSRVSDAAAA